LVANKGVDIARVIREATAAHTPLDTARNQVGLQAQRITPFAIMDPPPPPPKQEEAKDKKPDAPDLPMIKNAVRELNPGDSSEFVPTAQGGLIAIVEKRDPADPAGYDQAKTSFEKNYLQSKRAAVFDEWLQDRRRAANLQGPPPEVKAG